MKRFFALFLLSAVAAFAQMQTFDLAGHGRLTIYLAGDWKVDDRSIAKQGTITINPTKESVNAACTIGITYPDVDRFDTKQRLKLRVEADSYGLAEQSVERKAYAKEFSLSIPSAYGYFCSFTDPELRGQPPQKGNYKVISVGKIRLTPNVVLDVSIMADGFRDAAYNELLGAIEGMEFTPARGR
jgi:hypothetical protein